MADILNSSYIKNQKKKQIKKINFITPFNSLLQ